MNIGVLILAHLMFALLSFTATLGRKILIYASLALGGIIFCLHGAVIVARGLAAGRAPFTNTYETLILLGFLVTGIYLFTYPRYRTVYVGGFAGLTSSILLALTSLLSPDIEPLVPALKSNWLLFHVTSAFIGYASFAVAFGSAAGFLLVDGAIRWRVFRGSEERLRQTRQYLNYLTSRLISVGFAFLSLGIALGAVWANVSWGRYWNWDPKEAWAFITWTIYVVCLHVRSEGEGHERRLAFITLAGFIAVMFTYFGVNFWLASLHAYS